MHRSSRNFSFQLGHCIIFLSVNSLFLWQSPIATWNESIITSKNHWSFRLYSLLELQTPDLFLQTNCWSRLRHPYPWDSYHSSTKKRSCKQKRYQFILQKASQIFHPTETTGNQKIDAVQQTRFEELLCNSLTYQIRINTHPDVPIQLESINTNTTYNI